MCTPWIETRKRGGRKYYLVRWKDSSGRIRSRSAGRRKRKADKLLNQITKEHDRYRTDATLYRNQPPTFKGLLSMLQKHHFPRIGPKTQRQYIQAINLLASYAGPRLDDVTPLAIDAMIADMLQTRMNSTVNNYLRFLKTAFKKAVSWDMLDRDPFRSINQLTEIKNAPVILTKPQELRLYSISTRPKDRAIIALALAGLRAEEISRIHIRKDINLESGVVTIRNRANNTTKSKKYRISWLPAGIRKYIRALRQPGHGDYPLYHKNGNAVSKRFVTLRNRARLTIKLHELRATCYTRLAEAGCPALIIQQIMGHASLKVGREHYLNLDIPKAMQQATQKV